MLTVSAVFVPAFGAQMILPSIIELAAVAVQVAVSKPFSDVPIKFTDEVCAETVIPQESIPMRITAISSDDNIFSYPKVLLF